jgi:rRNA processing protein Gar1
MKHHAHRADIVIDRISQGLPELPAPILEAAAIHLGRLRDAAGRVDEEGLLIADAKGNPVPHPALEIERQAAEQLRRLLS